MPGTGTLQTEEAILQQEKEAAEYEQQVIAEREARRAANKNYEPHIDDAEDFEEPVQITRTKVIDDKIVIDRRKRKMIIEYRTGNIDTDGNFIDQESHAMVHRDEDFDNEVKDIFSDDKLFFAKIRGKAKNNIKQKYQQVTK